MSLPLPCRRLGLPILLLAALGIAGPRAGAETTSPVVAAGFITDMGDRAVATLAMQGDRRQRHDAFARLLIDAIDFDALALATLGRMARTVAPRDKREFTQLFAAHVIDVAIERFGDVQILRFTVAPGAPLPNGDVRVHTRIERAGGEPLEVDWRVRSIAGRPKINDIEVAGYSLMIHYRGEFERANVSTVPGLIAKLRGLTAASDALETVRRDLR
ncbi:MAG: ABC transporter substrate-binding protein [Alphaproteobacteria bacterium]|nr:ABC transporter substrate-binding protein [Alphaproteobacteria bacterium]